MVTETISYHPRKEPYIVRAPTPKERAERREWEKSQVWPWHTGPTPYPITPTRKELHTRQKKKKSFFGRLLHTKPKKDVSKKAKRKARYSIVRKMKRGGYAKFDPQTQFYLKDDKEIKMLGKGRRLKQAQHALSKG